MTARRILPQRRPAETFDLRHGNQNNLFAVTLGYFPDGSIGEVFICGAKAGSEVEAVARDGAVLLSLAIQHGVPVATLAAAITREQDGRASTIIGVVLDKLTRDQNVSALAGSGRSQGRNDLVALPPDADLNSPQGCVPVCEHGDRVERWDT